MAFWQKLFGSEKPSKIQSGDATLQTTSDAELSFRRGVAYRNGQGVAQDYAEAVKYYRQAAEQGHVMAQMHLGSMYLMGRGVPRDLAEAEKWHRQAV